MSIYEKESAPVIRDLFSGFALALVVWGSLVGLFVLLGADRAALLLCGMSVSLGASYLIFEWIRHRQGRTNVGWGAD